MLLKSSIYLLIILIQFTSSTLNTQQKEYQKKEQQVLLNPVIRSLIRQRLNKLKKEAILLGQRNEQQNININSDLQQVVKTESNMQYIPLNCFFSPVTCRLPIIGVKRKQRRQNLINKQQKNIKNENKMEEREEEPKVGRYFLALTYFSSPQKFLTREDNL
uniref:Candidate secreted effector n=1 Tax=Meloidogyne incognita TaxID=6306 RepID=A0A914MY18_MELIC